MCIDSGDEIRWGTDGNEVREGEGVEVMRLEVMNGIGEKWVWSWPDGDVVR